jgi:hypothetical protein
LGTTFTLPVEAQGPTTLLADGTRMHDQKIAAPGGARYVDERLPSRVLGDATRLRQVLFNLTPSSSPKSAVSRS